MKDGSTCRRKFQLNYFGEKFSKETCEQTCDNCKNEMTSIFKDYTEYAKCLIENLNHDEINKSQLKNILKGSHVNLIKKDDNQSPETKLSMEALYGTMKKV